MVADADARHEVGILLRPFRGPPAPPPATPPRRGGRRREAGPRSRPVLRSSTDRATRRSTRGRPRDACSFAVCSSMRCRLPRPPHCATKRPPASSALATPSKTAWWSGIQCSVAALNTASNAARNGNAAPSAWTRGTGAASSASAMAARATASIAPDLSSPTSAAAHRVTRAESPGSVDPCRSRVEDPLAGHRLQTRDDSLTPVELRLRHAVITRGIPISHCPFVRWSAVRADAVGEAWAAPEPWRRRVSVSRSSLD